MKIDGQERTGGDPEAQDYESNGKNMIGVLILE